MSSRNYKEGSGEIEAANRHLKSMKKVEAMLLRNVKDAEKLVKALENDSKTRKSNLKKARALADRAKKDYDSIRADLANAQSCFDATCEKWEVVDLADDDSRATGPDDGSEAKCKKSEVVDLVDDDSVVDLIDHDVDKEKSRDAANGDVNVIESEEETSGFLLVQGCGFARVNGRYEYKRYLIHDKTVNVWRRAELGPGSFVITKSEGEMKWHIYPSMLPVLSAVGERGRCFPLYSASGGTDKIPPEDGWMNGVCMRKPPSLRWFRM